MQIVESCVGSAVKNATRRLLAQTSDYAGTGSLKAAGVAAEIIGAQIVIHGPLRIPTSKARRFNYRAMVAEAFWNLSPTSNVTFLANYVKNIRDFCDGGDKAAWAYGPYLNGTIVEAVDKLRVDPLSRQAIVYTGVPPSASAKNSPPCLSTVQWLIRGGQLIQIVTMRSNDVYLGLPLDIMQFSIWHQLVASHLNLEMGAYIHNSSSLHLYERDVDKAWDFLAADVGSMMLPSLPGNHGLLVATRGGFTRRIQEVLDGYLVIPNDLPHTAPYAELLTGLYREWPWATLKASNFGRGW